MTESGHELSERRNKMTESATALRKIVKASIATFVWKEMSVSHSTLDSFHFSYLSSLHTSP
jgi:hypothetical protein